MQHPHIQKLPFESYLAMIQGSIGTTMFQHYYALIDNAPTDVLEGGNLSCAYFVSCVLRLFDLVKSPHRTVTVTLEDMLEQGWQQIAAPRPGAVLVWEKMDFGDGDMHEHIGFALSKTQAVSNSYKLGHPVKHDIHSPKRKLAATYWHPAFTQSS